MASGSISLARENLRNQLANVAAFRTWTGTANPTAALARIYVAALPPPSLNNESYKLSELQELRPYALVWTSGHGMEAGAMGSHLEYRERGELHVRLVQDVPSEDQNDPASIENKFADGVGSILDGLLALSGINPYLSIVGAELNGEFERSGEDAWPTEGDYVVADLIVRWEG